jgi:hypothetical protein
MHHNLDNEEYVFHNSEGDVLTKETTLMSTIELINKYQRLIKNPNINFHSNGLIRYDGKKYHTQEGLSFDLALENYKALKHLSDEQIYGLISNIQIVRETSSGTTKRLRTD